MLQYNTKPKLTSRRKDTTRNRYKDYSSTSHSTNYIHNYNNNSSRCPYGNKYYNVIPLHSILALLLVGMIGNPYVVDSRVYAQEDGNSTSNSTNTNTMGSSNSYEDVVREKSDGNEVGVANEDIIRERSEGDVTNVDSTNYTISRAVSSSTSLTITTPNLSTIAPVGEVSYLSSNVTYSANDISSYSMKISYAEGNSSLSNSNITDSSGNTTTITGAGGKTPASMSSNTWGYALADTNANNTTLTYNTMPAYGSGTTIVSGNAESVPTTTKKLVFASKFAEHATSGHYRTKVLLSLTATPKKVANIGGISTMQEMTAEICRNSDIGAAKNLRDTRDGSEYSIRKHEDGNCWMTQNLRITKESLANAGHSATITSADSDVASFTFPTSSINGFSDGNYYSSQIYYANSTTHGAYYSFTAATAGTGNSSLTSGSATSSVCPKGWELPSSGGKGSYSELMNAANITTDSNGYKKIRSAPYSFSESGGVHNSVLGNTGAYGGYWTHTAVSNTVANYLYIYSSGIKPADINYRSLGRSVRCVAIGS